MVNQAILVLLADLVILPCQEGLVFQLLLFLVLPLHLSLLEYLETLQGPFHLDNNDTMSSSPAANTTKYFKYCTLKCNHVRIEQFIILHQGKGTNWREQLAPIYTLLWSSKKLHSTALK